MAVEDDLDLETLDDDELVQQMISHLAGDGCNRVRRIWGGAHHGPVTCIAPTAGATC